MAQHYDPEEVSGAVLATQLASGLVHMGHEVTFVTAAPSYPHGQVFSGYHNALYQSELSEGVRVIRTWSYISPKSSLVKRMANNASFSAGAFFGGLFARRPQVILSYSPPLPLGLSALLLSRLWRIPWVLRVEDIYPDVAVAIGALRSNIMIRILAWLECFLYRKATRISVPAEGFRDNLIVKGTPILKLEIIPMWADAQEILPQPKKNTFRQGHGLEGKFIILYAGNMGYTAALEEVIHAAGRLQEHKVVQFVLVGEGVKKHTLQKLTQDLHLENVLFLAYQPRQDLPEILAAADLSLVTLNLAASRYSVPNKLFSIMASGRPALVIAPLESELASLVEKAACGWVVPPEDPERLANTILELMNNQGQLEAMGANGRQKLESEYTRERCVQLFDELIQKVAS